jgi:hypothetical protein
VRHIFNQFALSAWRASVYRKRYTATLRVFGPAFSGLFVAPLPGRSSSIGLWSMAAFLSRNPR